MSSWSWGRSSNKKKLSSDDDDFQNGGGTNNKRPKTELEKRIEGAKATRNRKQKLLEKLDQMVDKMKEGPKKEKKKLELAQTKFNLAEAEVNLLMEELKSTELTGEERQIKQDAYNRALAERQRLDPSSASASSSALMAVDLPYTSQKLNQSLVITWSTYEEMQEFWIKLPFMAYDSEFNSSKQQELLGRFYKQGCEIPIIRNKIDMRVLNRPRPTADLIEQKFDPPDSHFLIAVSGTGKSSTIFHLARKNLLIYIQCTEDNDRRDSGADESFIGLHQTYEDVFSSNNRVQRWAEGVRLVTINVLCRLMLLGRMIDERKKQGIPAP